MITIPGTGGLHLTSDNSRQLAVVLLSGGLDSATTAAIARQEGFLVHALSVDYGQRHRFELSAARQVAESLGIKQHVILAVGLEKGTGPICAQHPPGRSGKLDLSPFPAGSAR